jgi:hypothetical protein
LSSIHIDVPVICPDGTKPVAVSALLGTGSAIVVPLSNTSDDIWSGDIPIPDAPSGTSWPLTLLVDCPGEGTITILIGDVALIDPSGLITNAENGQPIQEATVTLQRLDNSNRVNINPFALTGGNPAVKPQVNPELTDDIGHYGWDVIAGTYRVVVDNTGHVSQTSYQVTVPPPVLDLNLALVPAPQLRSGDVDCNTTVDSIHALKVLLYLAQIGADPPCLAAAYVKTAASASPSSTRC